MKPASPSDEAPRGDSSLPSAMNDNIEAIAGFYARHEEKISPLQNVIEQVCLFFGRPSYLAGSIGAVLAWIGANLAAPHLGWRQFDPPPFNWLQAWVSLNAFIVTVAVLIRQNRIAHVAAQQAHLDLQVNLLTEQKTTKIIELLEELRRDMPNVHDRVDPEVEEMKTPTDTGAMLNAIEIQPHRS